MTKEREASAWEASWGFLNAFQSIKETLPYQSCFQIISVDNDGLAILLKTGSLKQIAWSTAVSEMLQGFPFCCYSQGVFQEMRLLRNAIIDF